MPGDGASGGQAVCRPRGVEHLQDVPRVFMHSNLGEKTSRGIRLCFSLQCYHSKFYSLCQAAISLLANKIFSKQERERHPRPKPKAALPLCYGKVFKIAALFPSNQRGTPTWEIIRATPGKASTGDFPSHFQPLLLHFFERVDW